MHRLSVALLRSGLLLLTLTVAACTQSDPIKIGFLAGLSGRGADLGIAGRNGVMLAIEQRNQQGGIDGHRVQIVIKDDGQSKDQAHRAVNELVAERVAAIIGPMTSSMAMEVVPIANAAQLVMLSPTVTTDALSGIDDYFFRISSPTSKYAKKSADYHFKQLSMRQLVGIYDLGNRAFAESWYRNFAKSFTAAGGELHPPLTFESSANIRFSALAEELLATESEGILIVANAMDSALLIQQIRKRNQAIHIATSEWAATEKILELGGNSVEGVVAGQFFDRYATAPQYLAHRAAYRQRFGQEPGFASVAGFDAANLLMDALAKDAASRQLKTTLLKLRAFNGIQSKVELDQYGDAMRPTFVTRISDGRFKVVSER